MTPALNPPDSFNQSGIEKTTMFKISNKSRLAALLIGLMALVLMTACSSEPEPEPAEEQVEAAEPAPAPTRTRRSTSTNSPTMETLPTPESAPRFRYVPDVDGQLTEDGLGLQTIIDGSSAESFRDSLTWIASDTSPQQYSELEQAIRFINNYDRRVLGNDERMRGVLDGLTGEEVIELAAEINSQRSGLRGN